MGVWLVPKDELTTEQIRAIEMDPHDHRLLLGGPGSGKTQVLVHRAEFLRASCGIPHERMRIFVYTNVLKEYIESGLEMLDLPTGCVSTLDHWCREFYESNIGRLPWNSVDRRPDFAAVRRGVLEELSSNGAEPPYEVALVDEGQDIDADGFAILKRLAKTLTVCMDHNQQIYDAGSSQDTVLRTLGLKRQNLTLLETFRCCPYIVDVASEFITESAERRAYIEQTRTANTDIETPLLYCATGFEDEKAKLVDTISVRLAKGERIAVLLPQKRQVHGFAQGLREVGLEVETQDGLDFDSDRPKLITYHSAKGLTFDTVLLPRLTSKSFYQQSAARIERLLFVGITRATSWVYMSTTEPGFGALNRLRPLESARRMTIQKGPMKGSSKPTPKGKTKPAAKPAADDLDFL